MNSIQLEIGDQYDKQCGEMYLTLKGNIVFHCTLCENKYEKFETYADHILALHYGHELLNIKQEIVEELNPVQLNDDNLILPPIRHKKRPPPISELMTRLFDDDSETSQITVKQEVEEHTLYVKPSISGLIESAETDGDSYLETFEIKMESDSDADSAEVINEAVEQNLNTSSIQSTNLQTNDRTDNVMQQHYTVDNSITQSSSEQVFVCNVCGKGFPDINQLQTHLEFYVNEKNTKCPICEFRFESNHTMHRHFSNHINERNYKCDICEASFKKKKGLLDHKIIHDDKTFYSCRLCNAQFTLKAGLKWHMRIKHSKKSESTYNSFEMMQSDFGINSDVMISAALL